MKLSQFLEKNFTHVTFDEYIGTLKVPKINVDLTYGLLSTENKDEFKKLVFHLAPVGTIIDDIPEDFYEGKLLIVRNMLTKMLMEEPNHKMAERFLNVLERRDKAHWSKDKKVTEIKAESVPTNNADNGTFNLVFTVKE